MSRIILAAIVTITLLAEARGADWVSYRADAARSGYTAEQLPEALSPAWTYRSSHTPTPAWPNRRRLPYDRAYQVVIADGKLYFGSSADGKVYALDAASGQTRWTFFTDGPVRFAPAVWRDRIFVAGDDGWLYCLAAADGKLLWRQYGGPREDMLLGNDRMISRWPARGGPAIADGVLYYAAGIWPSEGIFICAVDAATGKRLWCNDSSGGIEMNQPHGGARAKSGVSAQGYLVVDGDTILVPTGRAVPAAFSRADGTFRYFHLQANKMYGGSQVAAVDGHFFNRGVMFATGDGRLQNKVGEHLAVHPKRVVFTSPRESNTLIAVDRDKLWIDKESIDRKGKKKIVKTIGPPAWTTQLDLEKVCALIVAGDRVIAGGPDKIAMVDIRSGQTTWMAKVDGAAYSLAAADGRLYASTDRGAIHCFGDSPPAAAKQIEPVRKPAPAEMGSVYATAAEEIIGRSGVKEGYCLDLACGDGRLALELARRTKLRIYAVDSERANVEAARRMLDAEGLYGVRVTVHQADPAVVPYPNYFADLVVSGRSVTGGSEVVPADAALRMQRPGGGVACLGKPGAMKISARRPLEGGRSWTHQYADPANTLCSGDVRLAGPLVMLWFRDTDIFMPNRHGRGPAPLVVDGRMFVEGVDTLRAVSTYNGRTLWEYPLKGILRPYHQEHLMGASGTGSNFCIGGGRLFVHTRDRCLCIDVKTGRKMAELHAPPTADGKPGTWGHIAYADGTLFGSLADTRHVVKYCFGRSDMNRLFTESRLLFALDAETGKLKWKYRPEHSIRHNAIAIGNGRVHLIDRPLSRVDDIRFDPDHPCAKGKTQAPPGPETVHKPGRLITLDAGTGKILWKTDENAWGTLLALSTKHDVLLMSYQSTRFKLNSEPGGRMAAFRSGDGVPLWDIKAEYMSRPILNDRTIYAQPGAWNLLTGEQLPFEFTRSYGCGTLAGSARLLVFRSATLGYYDLAGTRRTENYGGIRPGCWINAIPAEGLVLLADAASWCTCSYLNQATIALQPGEDLGGGDAASVSE